VNTTLTTNPAVETALSLAQVYWLGLRGVIDGVAQVATGGREGDDAER
jgi:hypothetical protein